MITNIKAYVFPCPVPVRKGDRLCVNHNQVGVIDHESDFDAEWTCSITFQLDGQTNWILGNQATLDWLKTLGPVETHPQ